MILTTSDPYPVLVQAPAVEPVTLAEAKLHLRVEHSAEDTLIESLIAAAREGAEHLTGRALITQRWELSMDGFPAAEIRLAKPPVQSIVSISYTDPAGAPQVLDPSAYSLDAATAPGWVLPSAAAGGWPATFDGAGVVKVLFQCGYGATGASVPQRIRAWMLLQVGTLYKHREEVVSGVSVAQLPSPYTERLLDPFRTWEV